MSDDAFTKLVNIANFDEQPTKTFKVGNPQDLGNAIKVADEASRPSLPSVPTIFGRIYFAESEGTFWTVNIAGDDWVPSVRPLGGASETIQVNWAFDSTDITATDPTSKKFKFNNATPASVTAIYVSDISNSGIDVSTIFAGLESGDKLYIQQIDAFGKNILFNVTGITDNTGWFTITVTVDDDTGGLFGDTKDCAFDFDWVSNVGDGAINKVDTLHSISTDAAMKTAVDNVIANPRKSKNIFKVSADLQLESAEISTGTVEADIHYIADQTTLATRPKITDKGYQITVGTAKIKWDGIDYESEFGDSNNFFNGVAGGSSYYEFSNSDFFADNNRTFIKGKDDNYTNVKMTNCTGTITNTGSGFFATDNNGAGAQKEIMDIVLIGCDFTGLLAAASDTVEELNITLINCNISNNGNGVWNATGGGVVNVFIIDSQVSRDIVAGSSAINFTVIKKAESAPEYLSDQDTDITINTPITFTATEKIRLLVNQIPNISMKTAPTGSTATFDIHVNSVSVFITIISVDAGQKTSLTAATPAVLDTTKTLIDVGDLVEYKIVTIGSTIKGTGVKLNIPHLIEA